jgi:hypothetical protein
MVFALFCAAASVALGAIYMFAAGATLRYIVVNAAALLAGVAAASLVRRVVVNGRAAEASTICSGLLLVATAMLGVQIDGASRWFRVSGISLQPSLILLPLALLQFARNPRWSSSIGMAIAGVGLAMQPDRAMAGTLVAGLAALWLCRRERPVTVALLAAIAAFMATLVQADVLQPVLFVEQVVQSAFAFHVLTGLAIVAGLATMMMPAVAGLRSRARGIALLAVFGATWLAVIAFAIFGNYPTPLVGYGSSAILGYCLSAAALGS